MKTIIEEDITVIDPTTIKVGDRVRPRKYKGTAIPSGLKRYDNAAGCVVEDVKQRHASPEGEVVVTIDDRDYGYEWFLPLVEEQVGESTILIDSTGTKDQWTYDPEFDCWQMGDRWSDPTSFNTGYYGFDEGAEDLIKDFGLADEGLYSSGAEPEETQPLRSSLTHDTSKDYAEQSISRKLLSGEQNLLLQAAAHGEEVDVYEFRKAATAALNAAVTRAGTSPARREYAKKARHLIYWADSIIDNHAKGLPVYEKGERSPKLQEVKVALADAKEEIDRLVEVIDERSQEISDLSRQVESLEKQVTAATQSEQVFRDGCKDLEDEVARLLDVSGKRDTLLAETVAERDVLAEVLSYALDRLKERAPEERARIFGFWDARAEQ